MATHSIILAWKIPWMEQARGLQSMGSQGVRYNRVISSKNKDAPYSSVYRVYNSVKKCLLNKCLLNVWINELSLLSFSTLERCNPIV